MTDDRGGHGLDEEVVPGRLEQTPYEDELRAHAMVLADLGRLDEAECLLVGAVARRAESPLSGDLRAVREHRDGFTRADAALMEGTDPQGLLSPEKTALQYWQINRQRDHDRAKRFPRVVAARTPAVAAAALVAQALVGIGSWVILGAVLLALFSRAEPERRVRRGVGRARPLVGWLLRLAQIVPAGLLGLTAIGWQVAGRPVQWHPGVGVLSASALLCVALSLAVSYGILLLSPPEERREHYALTEHGLAPPAGDETILTHSHWAQERSLGVLALLVLGSAGWMVVSRDPVLAPLAGFVFVGFACWYLPQSLVFLARCVGRGPWSFRGAHERMRRPERHDVAFALVPPILVILGIVV